MRANHSAGKGPVAGAGLRMTCLPSSRALAKVQATVSTGTSSWQMTTSAACNSASKRCTDCCVNRPLPPGMMTMQFWLAASTVISATPLDTPGQVLTPWQSMPSTYKARCNCRP